MHLLQSLAPLHFSRYPPSIFHSSPLKTNFALKALNPRTERQHLSVACRSSKYLDQQRYSATPPPAQSPQPPAASTSRVFVGYSIYKGKAALTVEPRAPEFAPLDSGAFKVSKEGFLLLQFAPAVAVRQYDWNRKQVFSLSVAEIGTLMSLGAKDSCEFFHDPFKGRGEEGKIRKLLKAEPLPDGTGHFFNLKPPPKCGRKHLYSYLKSRVCCAELNFQFHLTTPFGLASFCKHYKA